MSGMLTHTHGILHHSFEVNGSELKTFNDRKVRLMQEILKENGYATYGLDFLARWHSRGYDYYPNLNIDRTKRKKQINHISKLFKMIGLRPYFKKFQSSKIMRRLFGGFDSYPKDSETVQKAIELISKNSDPYFLFVHFWGVHKSMSASKDGRSVETYDASIEVIDNYIKEIVHSAGDDTLFVILGDHGESLGENDIWFDHHGLYDPSLHIPLIFSGTAVPSDKKINGLVSITDVFETIFSIANINYSGKTNSKDLTKYFNKENDSIRDYIFAEENYYQDKVCIRTKKYKFIKTVGRSICEMCRVKHGEDTELFNLVNDPGELINIATSNRKLVEEFEEKIKSIITSQE